MKEAIHYSLGNGVDTRTYIPQLRVSVIIPVLNEAENLPHILPLLKEYADEIVIIDGHSQDDTVAVARKLLPKSVIIQQEGRGKGDALRCGFARATGDILVMFDADGSADPAEIPAFVDALVKGADFAKGSRFLAGGGSADFTRLRQLGNFGLTWMVNILFRSRYTDLCYGYNAFWSTCLPHLANECDGFEIETALHLQAMKSGLHIVEIPSYEHSRLHGESKLNAFRDGWRIAKRIMNEWLTSRQPARPRRQPMPQSGQMMGNALSEVRSE